MKTFVVLGGSMGLGDAFAKGLPAGGDRIWIVSRTAPVSLQVQDGVDRRWIRADLAQASSGRNIADAIGGDALDVAVYNAGIWESRGFTPQYDFEADDPAEIARIVGVNLTSAITCLQALLPNLRRSGNAKIVLVGSTDGLENVGSSQAAYVASKFGLRGAAHALRSHVRKDRIGVTVLNLGTIAGSPFEDGLTSALDVGGGRSMPAHDIVALVRCIVDLSAASCVKEVVMPAMADENA